MATFAEVKDSVAKLVLEQNSEVIGQIDDFVKRAQEVFEDGFGLPVLQKDTSFQTVNGLGFGGPLPTDFNRLREPLAILHKDTSLTSMSQITRSDVIANKKLSDPTWGQPSEFLIDHPNDLFLLFPTPNIPSDGGYLDTGKYTIAVYYWGREATLSDDADTNWFTLNARYALIWEAAALAFEFNSDPIATYWFARAKGERRRLRAKFKRAKFETGFTLAPVRNRLGSTR